MQIALCCVLYHLTHRTTYTKQISNSLGQAPPSPLASKMGEIVNLSNVLNLRKIKLERGGVLFDQPPTSKTEDWTYRFIAEVAEDLGMPTACLTWGSQPSPPYVAGSFDLRTLHGHKLIDANANRRKKLYAQCRWASQQFERLKDFDLCPSARELYQGARSLLAEGKLYYSLFAELRPRLLFIRHPWDPRSIALSIAAHRNMVPVLLIPGGYPPRSFLETQVEAACLASPSHRPYWLKLGRLRSGVEPMGWPLPLIQGLEPSEIQPRPRTKKHRVLIFGNLRDGHYYRSPQLSEQLLDLVRGFLSLDSVEKVTLCLDEKMGKKARNQFARTIDSGRFHVRGYQERIAEDLASHDLIAGLPCIELLYGAYFGIPTVEFHSPETKAIWGHSVLPESHVLRLEDGKKLTDACREALKKLPLEPEQTLYSYQDERGGLADLMEEWAQGF